MLRYKWNRSFKKMNLKHSLSENREGLRTKDGGITERAFRDLILNNQGFQSSFVPTFLQVQTKKALSHLIFTTMAHLWHKFQMTSNEQLSRKLKKIGL